MNKIQKRTAFAVPRKSLLSTAVLLAAVGSLPAQAYVFETGSDSFSATLDTNVRYNFGVRVQERDKHIARSANYDESDYAFDRGDVVTNRLDLNTSLTLDWEQRYGLVLSGAAWYDDAYDGKVRRSPDDPAAAAAGSYVNDHFSSYTDRYYHGPSGEILEAYLYNNFEAVGKPGRLTAGRQTILWGEVISLSNSSVSYMQTPTDVGKALANPGADARELAMPIGQIALEYQLASELSMAAQYFYEWEDNRMPEGGTYLGFSDFLFEGPDRGQFGPFVLTNGGRDKPNGSGDWGLALRWEPEWLGGTLGLYAREFDERNAWLSVRPALGEYKRVYAENTKLYGISFAKKIAGISTGMELVYRKDAALALGSGFSGSADDGPRGDTLHFLINGVKQFGSSDLWDSAALIAEFAYIHLDSINSGERFLKKEGHACVGGVRNGCVTRDAFQSVLRFSPTWVGVAPGMDLSALASLSYGLHGNSAVTGDTTRNQDAGNYTVSGTLTYNNDHQFSLAYNGYLAKYKVNEQNDSVLHASGQQLSDRGWVVFTYKTSF